MQNADENLNEKFWLNIQEKFPKIEIFKFEAFLAEIIFIL